MFENARILVTGGTGSFGKAFIRKVINNGSPSEIVVFSRDEKKQYDMRNQFADPRLTFIIGDVRDQRSVQQVVKGIDYIFHSAALKQVPSCEFFPIEAVRTNVLGSFNVIEAAEAAGVKKLVVLSTDKAVYPINAMGMTKALMEKVMMSRVLTARSKTVVCGVRYGNVLYSRGSVIPLFVDQIKRGKELTVTVPQMTRFLLSLDHAVDLVQFAMQQAHPGDLLVRKAPAATIENIAKAVMNLFNYKREIKIIGIRKGEKLHETLLSAEDMMRADEYDNYYRVPAMEQLSYERFFVEGKDADIETQEYNSANTQQLSVQEVQDLLLTLPEVQKELGGR